MANHYPHLRIIGGLDQLPIPAQQIMDAEAYERSVRPMRGEDIAQATRDYGAGYVDEPPTGYLFTTDELILACFITGVGTALLTVGLAFVWSLVGAVS